MSFAPELPIDTERLTLRWFDLETDVEPSYLYLSQPEVCRYVPFEAHTREQVVARLSRATHTNRALDEVGDALFFAVILRDEGRLIGDVMLRWAEESNAEIGYVFNPDYHGKGYATEAAAVMLRLAFEGLGVHRVTARIDEPNIASASVLRRLGMRQEAVLVENEWFKGGWSTEVDFAILDREWRAG